MKLSMTRPCPKCPFRSDVTPYIRTARMREILDHLLVGDGSFACHETVKHDDNGAHVRSDGEQHCAGALIMLDRMGEPNQSMRIGFRIRSFDPTKLDTDAPVYPDAGAAMAAYKAADKRGRRNRGK